MPDRIVHPAAVAVTSRLTGDGAAVDVVAVSARGTDAAAVMVDTDSGRILTVVQQEAGVWRAPTMLSGSARRSVVRPGRSAPPRVLPAVGSTRVRSVTGDGDWVAIRAVAAEDAGSVEARSSIDSSTVSIAAEDGGAVLILVRSVRDEPVSLSVRTRDGRDVAHLP